MFNGKIGALKELVRNVVDLWAKSRNIKNMNPKYTTDTQYKTNTSNIACAYPSNTQIYFRTQLLIRNQVNSIAI